MLHDRLYQSSTKFNLVLSMYTRFELLFGRWQYSCIWRKSSIRAHVGDTWISGYSRAHARASILDLKSKSRCHANGRARGRKVTKFSSRKVTKFSSRKNRITEFCDGHVVAGWLKQVSRQQTRERVVLDALFLFFPPSHRFWSCVCI